MKKLLLLFVFSCFLCQLVYIYQQLTEDSIIVIENVTDTTSVDSIVPNDSIQ